MGRPGIAAIIALAALSGWTSPASALNDRTSPAAAVTGRTTPATTTPSATGLSTTGPSTTEPSTTGPESASPAPRPPDLRIGSSITPTPVIIGSEAVYAMTVTNPDVVDATDVTVTSTLDESLFPGAVPSACVLTPHTVTCPGVRIPAGRSVTYEFPVTTSPALPDGTSITNDAQVTGGDTTHLSTQAEAVTDLEITADAPAGAKAGSGVPHTLTVTNHGPSRAQNVVVHSARGTAITGRPAECPGDGPILSCPLGALDPDETRTFTYTITPDVAGLLENCASVRTTSPEENTADNRTCTDTAVKPIPRPSATATREKRDHRPEPRTAAGHRDHRPDPAAAPAAPAAQSGPAPIPPPAHHHDPEPLRLTGASLWMLGLGVGVLLAVGLLVHGFSRRERTRERPRERPRGRPREKAGRPR